MIYELWKNTVVYLETLNSVTLAVIGFILIIIIISIIDNKVVKKIKAKRKRSNSSLVVHSIKYIITFLLIAFLIRASMGSRTDYSIIIGLLTAALGFSLQKPITGIAAWFIIAVKKPFYIGDRIIIGEVKGDVLDITLSHIVLQEVGGTVSSEDNSGRIINVPIIQLFEENIINYTLNDEYILDEITLLIEYESNLEKSEYIVQKSANDVLKVLDKNNTMSPYIRLSFDDSGISLKLRYIVPSKRRQEISSDIIRLIHKKFKKEKDIEIAYPHLKIMTKQKTKAKKKKK